MPQEPILLSPPHLSGRELSYIQQAFNQNEVAPHGKHLEAFERDLVQYLGLADAVALQSGTAALHLALRVLGVAEGDEVICQSFTFAATAYPVRYQGATPVFVDSESETRNMDPELLEVAIRDRISRGKRPKAILPVHIYGVPAKIGDILEIADAYGIPVVEDAAQALGSYYRQRPAGSFGKLAILSFNGNKIITTSGGGALVSNDKKLIDRALYLATQAREPVLHYQHSEVGYNYRMSNVLAAIGRGQFEVLQDRVAARRAHFEAYRHELSDLPGVSFPEEPGGTYCNRWLTTVRVDPEASGGITAGQICTELNEHSIECRPLCKPMHMQPIFEGHPFYGTGVSERLFRQGLCLPSGSNMTEEERARVISRIRSLFA